VYRATGCSSTSVLPWPRSTRKSASAWRPTAHGSVYATKFKRSPNRGCVARHNAACAARATAIGWLPGCRGVAAVREGHHRFVDEYRTRRLPAPWWLVSLSCRGGTRSSWRCWRHTHTIYRHGIENLSRLLSSWCMAPVARVRHPMVESTTRSRWAVPGSSSLLSAT